MLLVWILLLCLIAYIVYWALGQIPLPQPIRAIAVVVIALIFLVYIISRFGLVAGLALPPPLAFSTVWLISLH
jgi:hypothetical protein